MIEFYYNGLGNDEYLESFLDINYISRLQRGEFYNLGRAYIALELQAELHPFFNIFLSLIENVEDKSGIFQPRAIWEITQSIQCVFGGNIFYGDHNTEFGGFELFLSDYMLKAQNSAFVWFTCFF